MSGTGAERRQRWRQEGEKGKGGNSSPGELLLDGIFITCIPILVLLSNLVYSCLLDGDTQPGLITAWVSDSSSHILHI